MAGKPKPAPADAFEASIGDAERLVLLAQAFTNHRTRRMRTEKRRRVGEALGLPKREWDRLDCIESSDAFVVILPASRLERNHFAQHDPLLRQSVVAACAAMESYLGDRATKRVRELINGGSGLPARLLDVPMTMGQWSEVEGYSRRKRGITEKVLAPHIRTLASTSPSQLGLLLSTVGISDGMKRLDAARGVPRGTSHRELQAITDRRNRIAHEGDRRGHGWAPISTAEAEHAIDVIRSVVLALERIFDG